MPIYEYECTEAHRFESIVPRWDSPNPTCPQCTADTRRRPAAGALLTGTASVPPRSDQAPTTWLGTHRGNRDVTTGWRRALEKRAALEERHPELATPRSPVVAHEGHYHRAPLTVDELRRSAGRGSPKPTEKGPAS
ncbi:MULTISPECIES: FmdB family zinc ribbon protein [Streptomyces]|uniref:FmdB family zinc ribbon protein n=2 Tax=Streptomyces TaxID=1883 RepID=A0ABV9J990_9ACTN